MPKILHFYLTDVLKELFFLKGVSIGWKVYTANDRFCNKIWLFFANSFSIFLTLGPTIPWVNVLEDLIWCHFYELFCYFFFILILSNSLLNLIYPARKKKKLAFFQLHYSFLYKNNFIRTKALACCPAEPKNKVSRLAISKIRRTEEHQKSAWLSLILYCM